MDAACPLRAVSALLVGDDCGTHSVAQGPQICHCEAPTGPWQSRAGSFDTHEYLSEVKEGGSKDYTDLYHAYTKKYALQ